MGKLKFAMLGVILAYLMVWIFAAWAVSSVVTSAIKAVTNNCSFAYGIERAGVEGSLFCPQKDQ